MSQPEQWTCQCKEGYDTVFRQSVDGTSCDIEVACGAQQPILDEKGNFKTFQVFDQYDEDGNPTFKDGYVYGNRIIGFDKATEQCIVPTVREHLTTPMSIDYYTVSEDADPTCKAQQYSCLLYTSPSPRDS